MRYAYYPGCSAESTARDLHASSAAVARRLGIELIEPDGWSCCGATPAHQTDRILAASLSAVNLLLAQEMDLDMVVNCAECFSRLQMTNHEMQSDPELRRQIDETIGRHYDGSVRVRHFIEVVLEDVGIVSLQNKFTQSLNGLKVACYYGCLLVRPHEVTRFDDPENPISMDRLVTVMGGQSLDWPHKVECCGAGLALTRTDIVVSRVDSIIGMALEAGADSIAVACPLCQTNLDIRQSDINKEKDRHYNIPIVYVSQLLGLCLGISAETLGLKKLMVSPARVVEAVSSRIRWQRTEVR
jgi:heterodisulfide reductase subunit B